MCSGFRSKASVTSSPGTSRNRSGTLNFLASAAMSTSTL